jgi:hypothetical protein
MKTVFSNFAKAALVLPFLFPLASLVAFSSPSYANNCKSNPSRSTCDDQDPIATGCYMDSRTVATARLLNSKNQDLGFVELRYSAKCKTNWSKITISSRIQYYLDTSITRYDKKNSFLDSTTNAFGNGKQIYSRMFYSPNNPSMACGSAKMYASQRGDAYSGCTKAI